MAGDWIVWQKGLARKREVLAIAQRTGKNRWHVAGLLMEFWEWADSETADGSLPGLNVSSLSSLVADFDVTFLTAMRDVGWLEGGGGGLSIPNFERWMGRCSKRRLKNNQSQQDKRKGQQAGQPAVSTMSSPDDDNTLTTEQNRTEEIEPSPTPPKGGEGEGVPPEQQPEKKSAVTAGRPLMPCDRPDLVRAARDVVAHYQRVAQPKWPHGGGDTAVVRLMDEGRTEEELRRAADGYAEHCRANDVEPKAREAAKNFFTHEGQHGAFLDWEPKQKAPHAAPALPDKKLDAEGLEMLRGMGRSAARKPPTPPVNGESP